MASAEYPMPAKRPATERTQSLRPLFSWMTSTAPFGCLRRRPTRACSSPAGPAQVIGSVGDGVLRSGRRRALGRGAGRTVGARVGRWPRFARLRSSPHAAISAVAAAAPTPISASRAQRLPSGQQAVDVVGGDLLGDVALQWGHLGEYARVC